MVSKMVTINGINYTYIIDTEFDEGSVNIDLPEWINAAPEFGTIWWRDARTVIYTMRVSDAEKWVLDQLLINHVAITLTDSTYGLSGVSVWVQGIDAVYEAQNNYAKPWKLIITLLIIT
jgi:hypothetical protein